MVPLPRISTLFPYTTLFRSPEVTEKIHQRVVGLARQQGVAKGHKMRTDTTAVERDRKSTRLNSSHGYISYAVFCLKKKSASTGRRSRIGGFRCLRSCRSSCL